jgi:hypothetical protein
MAQDGAEYRLVVMKMFQPLLSINYFVVLLRSYPLRLPDASYSSHLPDQDQQILTFISQSHETFPRAIADPDILCGGHCNAAVLHPQRCQARAGRSQDNRGV